MLKDFAKLGTFLTVVKERSFSKASKKLEKPSKKDASLSRKFTAVGIGLCRTEHMFFEGDRIKAMREMILAKTTDEREKALSKILPMQREDFYEIFKVMEGLPVTIRLLDPPLHEFLPKEEEDIKELADELGVSVEDIKSKVEELQELDRKSVV